ncbi:serine/threonine-protein kinase [Streptomyces sp. NPDC051211]|uniref:serine/threonine-protein kinase n=1 Tax=Streptomyces sp. NPDC051211 TaxID=3154643 RepID=UPI00344CD216
MSAPRDSRLLRFRISGGAVRAGERWAGRYELVELLGRGGMGEVWKARDVQLGKLVAVKVLLAELGGEKAVARFRREAAIGARVRHPGIVAVHDAGQEAGRPYIVMELLEGSDLGAALAGKPAGLPVDEAVGLALQAAEVLATAHEEGIVHRDLKPANLFLQADGRVRICDFGIARSVDSTSGLTVTGHPFGTPAYMAPEQWRGAHVDARCDLYAFGCVLYALLTGSPPYSGDYYVLMRRHSDESAPSLQTLRSDVPIELDRLVAALLQKDPARRPHSARVVAAVLSRIRSLPGGVPPVIQASGGQPVEGPLVAWLLARVRVSTDSWPLAQAAELASRVSPALALELVEAAEARLWRSDCLPTEFMLAVDQLTLCWGDIAPRRALSLIAAAEVRFGHIDWVAGQLPGLWARFNPARALASARRLPPGKAADSAWTAMTIANRDWRHSLSWLDYITDPLRRELALVDIAGKASDTDMDEAMRILTRLTLRWVYAKAFAGIGFRRATEHSDIAGARHFLDLARTEEVAYLASPNPARSACMIIANEIMRTEWAIRMHEQSPPDRAQAPLDGATARARGLAIPDAPESHDRLLTLARECLGQPTPEPFGTELLDLISPHAPILPEHADTAPA